MPAFHGNEPDPATIPRSIYDEAVASMGPPQILMQPIARSPLAVGVWAVGRAPIHYQWQSDGKDVPWGTNAVLSLGSFDSAGTNRLVVIVKNDLGSVTSLPIDALTTGKPFTMGTFRSQGLLGLSLGGPPGLRVVVEQSVDLLNWVPVVTNTFPSDGSKTFPPITPIEKRQFFRAVAE